MEFAQGALTYNCTQIFAGKNKQTQAKIISLKMMITLNDFVTIT